MMFPESCCVTSFYQLDGSPASSTHIALHSLAHIAIAFS